MHMIDAKLVVYRKYERILKECEETEKGSTRNILLLHKVEKNDENIQKSSAIQRLTHLYTLITSIMNNFPRDSFDIIMMGAFERILSKTNIQTICNNVDLWIDSCHIGPVGNEYLCTDSREHRKITKTLIEKTLDEIEESLSQEICQKLLESVTSVTKTSEKENIPKGSFKPFTNIFSSIANDLRQPTNGLHTMDVNCIPFRNEVAGIVYEEVLRNQDIIKQNILPQMRIVCERSSDELQTKGNQIQQWKNDIDLPDLLTGIFFKYLFAFCLFSMLTK